MKSTAEKTFAGIDIGSRTIELVVVDRGRPGA